MKISNLRIEGLRRRALVNAEMDFAMFLIEDASYVAKRVDDNLTLLMHPEEQGRPIGARIEGCRALLKELIEAGAATAQGEVPFDDLILLSIHELPPHCRMGRDVLWSYSIASMLAARHGVVIEQDRCALLLGT